MQRVAPSSMEDGAGGAACGGTEEAWEWSGRHDDPPMAAEEDNVEDDDTVAVAIGPLLIAAELAWRSAAALDVSTSVLQDTFSMSICE